jgi:MFS family permease
MSAQFLSALADNAILVIAIALLDAMTAPPWMTPFLKFFFIASFVAFAFVVGALADAFPKPRVMFLGNAIKAAGCGLMLLGAHPLLAYALIGFGAAAYSPAKYGLLTELLPASQLVSANAWLEGLTIASVILGTFLGGVLVSPEFAGLVGVSMPRSPTALAAALVCALGLYLAAAIVNLQIPDSGRRYTSASPRALQLAQAFQQALRTLLDDAAGRASLFVTTLLWGVGATLQFVVIDWSRERLQLPLDRAAMLPGVVAIGVAIGAACAARWVTLERSLSILPLGLLLGPLVIAVLPFQSLPIVCLLLFLNGIAAGYFIVPMNALLQHRGHLLVNAGQAIAVQNFCENLSVMAMLGAYAAMRGFGVPLMLIIVTLGIFTSTAMAAIQSHRRRSTDRRTPGPATGAEP